MTWPLVDFARGLEHRGDLDRMVAVVVDDGDAVPLADLGEAALDAAELGERGADLVVGDFQLMRDGDRGGGVERVVAAGHRQRQVLDVVHGLALAVAEQHREARSAVVVVEIGQPHVGLRIFAVGDDAAVGDAADQALHDRMIGAHHGEAVERHVGDEIDEGLLHGGEGLEVIEVLGVDIGDDGDVGRQLEEGAVGFVGLDHHPVAGAEPRIGAVGVDDAAVDHGRVEPAGIEQRRDHRGGRGLAVGAGDGDAGFQPHQLGQHLGAPHHRQALLARGDEFRIVRLDGGGDHHDVGAVEVFGLVADRDLDALVAQALDVGVLGDVRADARCSRALTSTSAMPLMPMPPMPTKWIGPILRGSFMEFAPLRLRQGGRYP